MRLAVQDPMKLDPTEYWWAEYNYLEQAIRDDKNPDTSTLSALDTFLRDHLNDTRFIDREKITLPLPQSRLLNSAHRARIRFKIYDEQREKIEGTLLKYTMRFGHNCFSSNLPFMKAVYLLAKEEHLTSVLSSIWEVSKGKKLDRFESEYERKLAATTMGRIIEKGVSLDVSQYIWDDQLYAHEQIRKDNDPDFRRANALLRFLEEVRESESLTPFLNTLPSASEPPAPALEAEVREVPEEKKFGQWIVDREIGSGGQGSVYRVKHAVDGRTCALKQLSRSNRKARHRFKQEAEVQRRLGSDVAIRIIESREQDGEPLIVMELAKCGSLADQLPYTKGNIERSAKLFRQILLLTRACHTAGVVHRDLKPENILFPASTDEPRLADFGICFLVEAMDASRYTDTSERVGSRGFLAPEQDLGRNTNVDAQADIFSLGKILHWMLTGRTTEGDRLLHPIDYQKEFGDPRYTFIHQWLSTRLVVEHRQGRVPTVEQAIREFDELIFRLLSFVPGAPLPALQVPEKEDPKRWAHALSLIGRIPLAESDVLKSINKLQGNYHNTSLGLVSQDLGMPDDVVLSSLSESLRFNLVETVVPTIRKRNGSNQVLSLTELGKAYLVVMRGLGL